MQMSIPMDLLINRVRIRSNNKLRCPQVFPNSILAVLFTLLEEKLLDKSRYSTGILKSFQTIRFRIFFVIP